MRLWTVTLFVVGFLFLIVLYNMVSIPSYSYTTLCDTFRTTELFKHKDFSLGPRNPWLVVEAYNTEGGFFFQIYNVLQAAHYAQKYNMSLIVRFMQGLYLETASPHIKRYHRQVKQARGNWFEYYFRRIGSDEQHDSIQRMEENGTYKKLPSFSTYSTDQAKNQIQSIYRWDRKAYSMRDRTCQPSVQWKRVIRLQPWIQEKCDETERSYLLKNKPTGTDEQAYTIGVHYRGTDKYGNATSHEDHPIHYTYEFVQEQLKRHMNSVRQRVKKQTGKKVRFSIRIATDEEPFIQSMKTCFGESTVCYNDQCLRSPYSTSGLQIASEKCSPGFKGPEYESDPDCILYKQSVQWSIHRGFLSESKYRKGEEVLLDVLTLASCDCFFASQGNVSNTPCFVNPQLEQFKLNDLLRTNSKG